MQMTIQLTASDEQRLEAKARKAGMDLATYAERVLKTEAERPDIDEVLKPVRDAFAASGMSEDELSTLLVNAKKEMRADRRSRKAP